MQHVFDNWDSLFGIYLSFPILSLIEPKEKRVKTMGILTVIAFNILYSFICNRLGILANENLNYPIVTNYLIFLIGGYFLANCELKKKYCIIIYIWGGICFLHLPSEHFIFL